MISVPIDNVNVKNFKSLKDSGNLQLKPLTLLVGANSSGKSALLQSILVLKQTLESRNIVTPLSLHGKYVDLGSFKDIIFSHDLDESIKISLSFKTKSSKGGSSELPTSVSTATFTIGYDPEEGRLVNKDFIFLPNDSTRLDIKENNVEVKRKRLKVFSIERKNRIDNRNFLFVPKRAPDQDEVVHYSEAATFFKMDLNNLLRELKRSEAILKKKSFSASMRKRAEKRALSQRERIDEYRERLRYYEKRVDSILGNLNIKELETYSDAIDHLRHFNNSIENLLINNTYYIGPLREFPQRYYLASGEYPRDVGLRGEHTAEIIYFDFWKKERDYEKLRQWLRKTNLAKNLELTPVTEGIYTLLVVDPKLNIEVNLADIGFGASQLLPILVEGIFAKEGSLLLIEQPEIHLHPRLQSILADFFIEMTRKNKQLIVETHSEHIILRIQRRIAEGKISNDDVAIYYFESSSIGSNITKIELEKNGVIKKWPEGFFEDDLKDSLKMLKAVGKTKIDVSSS